jgi:hypothetical protein
MRRIIAGLLAAGAAWGGTIASGGAALAQGILVGTDTVPILDDFRGCMTTARKVLTGTGTVLQVSGGSVYGSNEERTIVIRCSEPGTAIFVEAFFPGQKDTLDATEAAFKNKVMAPLIPSESKFHQYSVDCTRQTSCQVDAAAICKQAYPASKAPKATVKQSTPCADAQGSYTCAVTYELDCN